MTFAQAVALHRLSSGPLLARHVLSRLDGEPERCALATRLARR
jgi:hypothetical protein